MFIKSYTFHLEFPAIMTRIMKWALLKLLAFAYFFVTVILHYICALFYWGKGKAVPPISNELLLKSATQLAANIREGKVKSEDVVLAYIERIREVEPFINATTYQRFSEAIREAKEVDKMVADGKLSKEEMTLKKPLLGIPISVKQVIEIKGLPFTAGSLDSKDVTGTEDSEVIKHMKQAGAIVLATTNTPEKGMSIESCNKLHGRTNNPYDISRSVGGSSGGEAALIAAGGSLIGLGNDSGGSIRIPSLFCGIYGHKPSSGLITSHGQFICIENVTSIGPMCRYAEDLELTMRALTQDKENVIKPISVNFKTLKVCYVMSIGDSFGAPLDPQIRLAFEKVLSHFESTYGIKAEEVNIPLLKKGEDILRHNLIGAVGSKADYKKLLDVPADFSATIEFLKYFIGVSKYTIIVPLSVAFFKFPLWYKESKESHYKNLLKQLQQVFDVMLKENTIFLCPTLPQTALHHIETNFLATSLSHVGLWNILGLPATHCPLGLTSKGLPLGIQVIASKNNDALNFAVACELERTFGGWVQPSKR